jgi:hypothetical protein
MNLRHRGPSEQSEDTYKCDDCEQQFSAVWNLKNHVRDIHGKKEDCSHFNKGKCKYPDKYCWKRHTPQTQTLPKEVGTDEKSEECYICKNKFRTKRDMMLHRLELHAEKVMQCRNAENCEFQKCWYKHNKKNTESNINNSQIGNSSGEETTQKTGNFQKAPLEQKPPEIVNL